MPAREITSPFEYMQLIDTIMSMNFESLRDDIKKNWKVFTDFVRYLDRNSKMF